MRSQRDQEEKKDLLTAQEVADRLSISVRTLYRLLRQGDLPPPVRYNRKLVRWKVRDIDAYIAALRTGSRERGPDSG